MIKPDYISSKDWTILNEKYKEEELISFFEQNYPYQYLIGDVDFCDSKILVNESVLIPRFETEGLVYKLVELIKEKKLAYDTILDIGTGSGCIIIALAKLLNESYDAIDLSNAALEVASKNAKLNEVEIHFEQKDILHETIEKEYDIVVSNPPYVRKDEEVGLSTKYEPQIALFAEDNGLEFYKKIMNNTKAKVYAFEIGCTQKQELMDYAKSIFQNATLLCEKDLAGLDRYFFIINE